MKKRMNLFFAMMLFPAALFAATITGKVTTGTGVAAAPVAGAKVVLTRGGGGGGGGGGTRLDSTTTNAQGEYTFTTDSTGFRRLLVSATGYDNGNGAVNVASATGTYTSNVSLAAAGGSTAGKGNISGTVTSGVPGTPVAGALVILRRGGGGGGGGFALDSAKTDAQGTFAFDSISTGNYSLQVSATGFVTTTRNGVAVTAAKTTREDFTVAAPVGPGSVAGKITNAANGSAIAGARVILMRGGGGGFGGRPDTVMTDAQGTFSFDSVANQANYTITVSSSGFSTAVMGSVAVAGGLKTTVDLALTAMATGDTTATLKGVVTNRATHAPMANVRVILFQIRGGGGGGGGNGNALDTMLTDANGAFAFTKLAPRAYRVSVSMTGFQTEQSNNLNLAAGETGIADFALVSPTTLVSPGAGRGLSLRSHWVGTRMVVDLDAASPVRAILVWSADGGLLGRVPVAPGSGRVVMPQNVKPGQRLLLQSQN